MHHEKALFSFAPQIQGKHLVWHPYSGFPASSPLSNGEYLHQPDWYRNFLYEQERARGLDFAEDLAAPGSIQLGSPPRRGQLHPGGGGV